MQKTDLLSPTYKEVWDGRLLGLAETVASWSKDPGTRVGCVITRPDKTIASLGFNGFPRGVHDNPSRANEDRNWKLSRTIHAEENAVLSAHERMTGCTAYVYPLPPCAHCVAVLIQAGVTRIVFSLDTVDESSEWFESHEEGRRMCNEAGVVLEQVTAV